MSQILVRFGTRGIYDALRTQKKLCKCLTYRALSNEAEGTRTLNLRIDRLSETHVNPCKQRTPESDLTETCQDLEVIAIDDRRCSSASTTLTADHKQKDQLLHRLHIYFLRLVSILLLKTSFSLR